MPGIASAATAVVIGHVAGGTTTIRVGAGGVMLPNHSPLVIAEQFGTLESLYPGRIDLGLGRAPGTDQTDRPRAAPRPSRAPTASPTTSLELQALLRPAAPGQPIRAVPGAGLNVPIWLLGSSLFSAQLAAALGLPFAFASHFAPDYLLPALADLSRAVSSRRTRSRSPTRWSASTCSPPTPTTRRGACSPRCSSSSLNLRRGRRGQLPPPVDDIERCWTPAEQARRRACAVAGDCRIAPDGWRGLERSCRRPRSMS